MVFINQLDRGLKFNFNTLQIGDRYKSINYLFVSIHFCELHCWYKVYYIKFFIQDTIFFIYKNYRNSFRFDDLPLVSHVSVGRSCYSFRQPNEIQH